ncbi:IS256 family transposase [Paenibacillus hemerocallicola]|uniref:Mutator family transposase n=1 Tax=Paenibacillus hemerocallicola TaxID=1172614 RepID=A0A5C4T8D1_9BACL|nr:IS256 family transposase [Paenibacillus hemerocallicola]TNJ65318.1 IS256 family transposase [Paenibacillus hemerocallicola]
MTTIQQNPFAELLENMMQDFLKEKIETLLKEEIHNYLRVEHPEDANSRNGYYSRNWETRYGVIPELRVPRDRQSDFQTELFAPYQRREAWLEDTVIHMYKGGMSTRDIGGFIEKMFGAHYSATTVSNITGTVLDDVAAWHARPLAKRYAVIYLDGMYVKLKRQSVASEVIYIAMGVDEAGHREILSFGVGGQESANGWRDVLRDLYKRGVHEVLLGVFDGLAGLEEAFRETYPQAGVQRCVTHKMRNTLPKIRDKDKADFVADMKTIYNAIDRDVALANFDLVQEKWGKLYPKELASWENELSVLLKFYDFPPMIHYAIYTSNPIERTIKEIRKRLRPMNSLTNMDAAEKIVYLEALDYNERWSERTLRGFADVKTQQAFKKMFSEKYPQPKLVE